MNYLQSRLKEASTYRGIVWLVVAVIGFYKVTHGESIDDLMVLAAAVVGGMGLTKDKQAS
jgi:hypothetical protein